MQQNLVSSQRIISCKSYIFYSVDDLIWSELNQNWEEFEYWTTQDKKTLKWILKLLKDIDRNGYKGLGKPEPLTEDLSSYWSRRIDDCNRIVYRIDVDIVKIVQCGSHYRDK